MLRKYATATIISAEIARRDALGLVKASHRAVFNYTPRPGFLYVRSRMISSRCNDNHDEFPAEDIKAAWKTAIGKPAFVNHHNEDHRRMRGVIIDAVLHEDVLPTGEPDTWIEALHEVDATRFPRLAQAIISGRVNRTSMGCDVGFSVCSACGNKASTPAEYCEHIPRMKGKILYRHTASGQREGHLIREICHKLSFFENSFLVEDPADPTAVVTGVDTRGLSSTAVKKTAVPNGMQFTYNAPDDFMPAHRLTVTFKAKNGRRVKGGHIWWHPDDGSVIHVQVPHKYQSQGIASALWQRAHELSAEQGLPEPKHSDVQTPQGKEWAKRVDERGLPPMAGPGQERLFDVPEQYKTKINSSASLTKLSEYWIDCARGDCGEHWGPNGAAGLLIRHHGDDGQTRYLLQRRSNWVDHGGTWGIPGGALEDDETPEEGARREAEEEMGHLPDLQHHRTHTDDHGNWAYHTVVADAPHQFMLGRGRDGESTDHNWFTRDEMQHIPLHPGFAASLGQTIGKESMRKEAVPQGIKFRFTPADDERMGHHTLRAMLPNGDQVGSLQWSANKEGYGAGMVDMVKTHPDYERQGIASTLWHRAHELANEHGVSVPTHSDVQFPAGRNWAEKVDREPVVMPGQQPLFERPEGNRTEIDDLSPQYSDIHDHIRHEHNADPSWAKGDEDALGKWHQRFHQYGDTGHRHASRKSAGFFKKKPIDWMEDPDRKVTDLNNGFHVLDHLTKDHGWSEEAFQGAGKEGWRKTHDRLHREGVPGMTDDEGMHFHGSQHIAGPAYPNPADHPFFQANPVSPDNIVRSFKQADEGRRAQGMRWYSDAHHLAGLIANGDHAKGAGVLAAYSPKAAWPDNMFNAARSFKEGRALGKGEGASIMGQHQRTAQKIIDGVHHSVAMKSPKISDFAHLIEHGDDTPEDKEAGRTRVVIDRHALSVATGRRMTTEDLNEAPLASRHYYEHVADQYRTAARRLSDEYGEEIKPHQVQAVTWGVQQEANQAEDEAAASAHAKGRTTRTRNSWSTWSEESKSYPKLHEGEPPNLHGRNPYAEEKTASSLPSLHLAYGETKAPADVDTLRTESCPVCGETSAFDGDRCDVCNFVLPPPMFQDPDTSVAKQMDLEKEEFDQGMTLPNGELAPNVDDQEEAMQDVPGEPGDDVADLFCPACGYSADAEEPTTTNDPSMPSQEGLVEGDICPNCGEATLLSPNDIAEMGGEVPQEIAEDVDADGIPDEDEPDVDEDGIPDDDDPDADGDGIPDEEEGEPVDEEEGEEPEDSDAVEDEDEALKERKDNSRRAK